MIKKTLVLRLVLFLFWASVTKANNVQLNNISLIGQNTTNKTSLVRFDLSWENSWRTATLENNWDAVWIFVKYRVKGQNIWKHATLDTIGHQAPASCKIDSTTDGKGVFIHASGLMPLQNVNYQNLRLRWCYGLDGLSDNDSVDICVFGVEMVYIPAGSFYVGDGNTSNPSGNLKDAGSLSGLPLQITSEAQLTLGGGASGSIGLINNAFYADDFYSNTQILPSAFPKGYAGFYCMKFEISQGQYADFLNKLNSIQASQRYPNQNGNNRHTISGSWPSYSAATPHRPCNFISYSDGVAYADWAGLRPMTELEFEKICRGTAYPVTSEYAWGSTNIYQVTTFINDGTASENGSNLGANAVYGLIASFGPIRCGWATGTSPGTRESTGSTYYGVRDMSGNLFEAMISIGSPNGRIMTKTNGDGNLDPLGSSNVAQWPSAGQGIRGGSFSSVQGLLSISNRYLINSGSSRSSNVGFRCVRSF